MNSSMLAKHAWRLINNPTALWVRVLKSLYFPNTEFVRTTRKRNNSWVRSSLIHGKDTLMDLARWVVGNGNRIDIREDCWVASGNRVEISGNDIVKVSNLMYSSRKTWDANKIRQPFQP